MASYNTMTFQFHSSLQVEDVKNDTDDGYHQNHHHRHNLSRLSVSSSSSMCCVDDAMAMYMSVLSIEGDYGDADAEFSDGKDQLLLSSDSDENHLSSHYYPLPAMPPRGSEGQKTKEKKRCRRMRKDRRVMWEKNRSNKSEKIKNKKQVIKGLGIVPGESGLRVITRPKGGRRSLCMDLEEVKACRDLGFELELDMDMEIHSPLSLSFSNSTLDTSGATSPIANWRISSPGDDPRDVKARLKMWAQAVAASASRYGT